MVSKSVATCDRLDLSSTCDRLDLSTERFWFGSQSPAPPAELAAKEARAIQEWQELTKRMQLIFGKKAQTACGAARGGGGVLQPIGVW